MALSVFFGFIFGRLTRYYQWINWQAFSVGTAVVLIVIVVVLCAVGFLFRGRLLAFLLTDLDYFTREDMAATATAVDHALKTAADKVGIQVKLRERSQVFEGGTRSRVI